METLISHLYDLAPYIHYISFTLLVLAGLNLPVSEDLVFIVSASIAATIVPENTLIILIACFSGAFISDIMAYLIGRYGASKLIKTKFFKRLIPRDKINTIGAFFKKYGFKTLFFGRFIPFGVRNAIFMTAGLVGVDMVHFSLIDLTALIITSSILFTLGYIFGENYAVILDYVGHFKIIIAILIVIFVITQIILYYIKKKNEKNKIYLLK